MNSEKHTEFEGLRKKLSNYHVDPPDTVWSGIIAGLDGKGRRRSMLFILAAAASLALAVSLGIAFLDFKSPAPSEFVESAIIEENKSETSIAETKPVHSDIDDETIPASKEIRGFSNLEQKVVEAISQVVKEEIPEIIYSDDQFEHSDEGEMELAEFIDEQGDSVIAEIVLLDSIYVIDELPEIKMKSKDPRWVIGAALSPIYSFRDAEGTIASNSAINNVESGMIAYAAGIQVGYRPASRFTIESGIFFNKMGINIGDVSGSRGREKAFDFSPVTIGMDQANIITVSNSIGNIVTNTGDIFLNSYKTNDLYEFSSVDAGTGLDNQVTLSGVQQNFEYLEIPLNLRYTLVDRSLELQLVGGLSTNFLVNNSVTIQTENGVEEIGYVSNLNAVNYSGNAGVGMIYHFHSNFSLSLEPRFRYYLNSINDETLPATRPYTLGIYTGINFRF